MDSISDIVRRLAENAEAVCRRYLSNGRREGRYWLVGDIHNAPGRSLYVLLSAAGDTRAQVGKWTDAASGEHGDLLDIIAASCGHGAMRETLAEARRFLSLPLPTSFGARSPRARKTPAGTPVAARRLWAAAKPVGDTLVAAYLAARGIGVDASGASLRYHPRCYYRASRDDAPGVRSAWPAMIAAVTDDRDDIVGVHRTWLDPAGGKAPVACPRRAMGHSRTWCPVRALRRRDGGGRRHRDDPFASRSPAEPPDDRGAVGGASCRHPLSAAAAPTLCRLR